MSKKCTPLWGEAHFQVKMNKTHQRRTTFGSWNVEKVRAVVARSTFPSQNEQNTPRSDHFWKLKCRKSARRCGAKREAHFQVKMLKTPHARTTFGRPDVEKVYAVVARSTFPSENFKSTTCSDHFWMSRCQTSVRLFGAKHTFKSKVQKTDNFEFFLTFRCRKSAH